ncbi:OsmC family protein, partial [Actinotignum urinale]|uniref:OsmC family protein n=1 Tax=Actinotignum urinale TaxID=190146 RepID=UPI00389A578C
DTPQCGTDRVSEESKEEERGKPSAGEIGHLHCTAVNDRGASVEIGKGPEQFTPGELMQLAVAGCQALSADSRFEQALGEDYHATFTVSADTNREENRFTAFHTALEVEF